MSSVELPACRRFAGGDRRSASNEPYVLRRLLGLLSPKPSSIKESISMSSWVEFALVLDGVRSELAVDVVCITGRPMEDGGVDTFENDWLVW